MICVFTPQKEEKPQKEKPHLKKPQSTELKRVITPSKTERNSQKKIKKIKRKDYVNLMRGLDKMKGKEKRMNAKKIAQNELNNFLVKKVGMGLLDLPDSIMFSDWINDDMTEEDIKEIVPDLAWELLDLSGMDRDSVDRICYPENFEI